MLDRSSKSVATVAAIAVTALVVAGGAAAADGVARPDDRSMRGPGAIALTNDWAAAESAARPDDRARMGPERSRRLSGTTSFAPTIAPIAGSRASAPLAQPTTGDGFDWIDAGIGSAATLGLVLLVAGASMMRIRQEARAA